MFTQEEIDAINKEIEEELNPINWINGIDPKAPYKYLWQFDKIVFHDENYNTWVSNQDHVPNSFYTVTRYADWYKEFMNVFQIGMVDAQTYWDIFTYLKKEPEIMFKNLINEYYLSLLK